MIKQMRLLYGKPYAQDERLEYVDIIASNAIQSMEVLLCVSSSPVACLSPHDDSTARQWTSSN